MNKKIIVILILVAILILNMGCTDSFAQHKNYCGDYCTAKIGVDRCINYNTGGTNIKSECADCVHSCLRELEGSDLNG